MTTVSPQTGAPWDRTRWDRLQASLLVAAIVIIPALPGLAVLAAIAGGMK